MTDKVIQAPERYMTISETARRLGRSESQIRTLIYTGKLPSFRALGRVAIPQSAVEQYALPTSRV